MTLLGFFSDCVFHVDLLVHTAVVRLKHTHRSQTFRVGLSPMGVVPIQRSRAAAQIQGHLVHQYRSYLDHMKFIGQGVGQCGQGAKATTADRAKPVVVDVELGALYLNRYIEAQMLRV